MNREQSMIETLREGMRSLREENTALQTRIVELERMRADGDVISLVAVKALQERITELEKALTTTNKLKDRLCELAGAPKDIMGAINLLGYRAGSCDWMPDKGYDYTCMITSCGEIYVFKDGYEDGDNTYCAHCGRKIQYVPNPEWEEGGEG